MNKKASPEGEAPSRLSLPRCPLVPDAILKAHNVHFEIDSRFRRAARLLQAFWLADQKIPTGVHVRRDSEVVTTSDLGSLLGPEAARSGKNFISPQIHKLVQHELVMREEGAAIDEERLFGNALSSMPLVFNLFGPMALDIGLATAVFRRLFPDFVDRVERISFEHSPGRRESRFLDDGTAFDVAIHVIMPDGDPGSIFVEVKYSEDMLGPAARHRDRYDEASRQSRLYRDPDCMLLRSLGLEQLWREHMLAQLAVDHGSVGRAVFLAIGPRLNRRVQSAFRVYESSLIDDGDESRVAFKFMTLEAVIDALSEAGATDIARTLWARYADFERVYNASLMIADDATVGGRPPSSTANMQGTVRQQLTLPASQALGRSTKPAQKAKRVGKVKS
ncbi:hypothetical protein SR870_16990 [Rhodopseudomonas palustris]|uniref:PGN_0703 family putative restriction endonuclease n=1 Tax=Rhodopseudomonas palustris TaxID=1076 RepID=UPI002ACE28C5|nr:hypothetical protein [Rhodopseudomonas palustris]WQG98387.1 hypothetical protein SR870_16990 [Rhodopseudomonas palustris]